MVFHQNLFLTMDDSKKLKLDWVQDVDNSGPTPILALTFNLKLTDSLLMFHICFLYKNNIEINIPNIFESIKESVKIRLYELRDDYINETYKNVVNKSDDFDICLTHFIRIKNELKSYMKDEGT